MTTSVVGRASVYDVLRFAGYEAPNHVHGFISCPIHAERSASFHVVGDGRGYRCFGCNAEAVRSRSRRCLRHRSRSCRSGQLA